MDSSFNITFDIDTKKILERLGLDDDGRVQRAIDREVLRICGPYVPVDTGLLKTSGILHTVVGSGEVVYAAENKARRLYYGEEDWNWGNGGMQDGGLRGSYWFDRAMTQGGQDKVIEVARKVVDE